MQEIETVSFGYLGHARRQRQAVRRVLKQRVIGNFDLMIVNARDARIEADGIGVSDEMDVVTAVGELEAELGGDDPAAAVGGVTGDSDSHGNGINLAVPIWPCRFSSGDAASPPPNQTRMESPSIGTDGSQITLLSQRSEPAKAPGSFSQITPSLEPARPSRRCSLRSRPV